MQKCVNLHQVVKKKFLQVCARKRALNFFRVFVFGGISVWNLVESLGQIISGRKQKKMPKENIGSMEPELAALRTSLVASTAAVIICGFVVFLLIEWYFLKRVRSAWREHQEVITAKIDLLRTKMGTQFDTQRGATMRLQHDIQTLLAAVGGPTA